MLNVVEYLLGDLDKQDKYNDDKQVVQYADSSDDDVDDLEYMVSDVGEIVRHIVGFEQRLCDDVFISIIRQRCVLHHDCNLSNQ